MEPTVLSTESTASWPKLRQVIGAEPHDIIYYFHDDVPQLQNWPDFASLQNAGEYRYFNTSETRTQPNKHVILLPGYVQPARVWCIEPGGWAVTDGFVTIDLGEFSDV